MSESTCTGPEHKSVYILMYPDTLQSKRVVSNPQHEGKESDNLLSSKPTTALLARPAPAMANMRLHCIV